MADQSHLDHPESWTTGDEPATQKQKDFIGILNGDDASSMSKSEASATIDKLKKQESQQSAQTSGASDTGAAGTKAQGSSAPVTDPKNWATGDEPATSKQVGYIAVMAKDAGEPVPKELNKSEASQKIEELKSKTGK